MTKDDELRLFASLANAHPRFAEWVREQLGKEQATLNQAVDIHLIYRQQGAVGFATSMLNLLEKAPGILHNR
jgi:hypothetical protein